MNNKRFTLGPFNKLILLGGGELLWRLSQWAKATGLEIAVITSPRHSVEKISGVTLVKLLTKHSVEFFIAETLDNSILRKVLSDPDRTFSITLGAAWIFNERLINDVFKGSLYNMHGTRLPQNRGGGGFSWQILTGNRFGFCNIHKTEPGIDEGEIIFSKEYLYPDACRTPAQFFAVYIEKAFGFLTEFLTDLRRSAQEVCPLSQPEYLSSYWPRLNTEVNGWIDWGWMAVHLERFICAFDDPYIGAQTMWNNKRIHIKKVSINLQDGEFHPFQSGIVYRKTSGWLCVVAGNAALVCEEVLDEDGKNLISQIKVGDHFYTPQHILDEAKKRVFYTASGIKQ